MVVDAQVVTGEHSHMEYICLRKDLVKTAEVVLIDVRKKDISFK